MKIAIQEVKDLTLKVLQKKGYIKSESEIISQSYIWSQMKGSSQGLNKLFGWRADKNVDAGQPTISRQETNLLLIDGKNNSHILACDFAVNETIKNIGSSSVYLVGVNNINNSAGSLGYFTEKFARSGLVAIMMSAADPGVVAYGGKTPVFGTNPISIAVPTKENPILLDMSTAALTWGDLVKYDNESKPLPVGLAFDSQGNPTTDPKKAMDGWVSTFDKSYKSSGLALMIQVLAGPLVGSHYSSNFDNCQYGSLTIVINPEHLIGRDTFVDNVTSMINEIKASQLAPGFSEISLPGENGYKKQSEANKSGDLEISDELYKKINDFLEVRS